MHLWKNTKLFMNTVGIITVMFFSVVEGKIALQQLEFEKKFTITDVFKSFVELIVLEAYENTGIDTLPEGFLRCYERMLHGKSTVYIVDLIEAYPVLAKSYHKLTVQQKAPRPDAPGNTDGAPVGQQLGCNLGKVRDLVNEISDIIRDCCAQLQQDFEFTWTILADILGTATSIDFSDSSTQLDEFENTLTACCSEIQQSFETTVTLLVDLETTITANFEGTFTVLQEILDSLLTPTVVVDFNDIFTVLTEINSTITMNFDATFTALADLKNTLTECCADIAEDVQGTYTVLAELQQTIETGFNGTFTELTLLTDGVGANLDTIVVTGFRGTFTALGDLKNTLTECCENLQQDFEDTWTILADIKQTVTDNFDGTFTYIETFQTGTLVIDLTPLFTTFAAGFNGTYTALDDLLETITEDFAGTFTALTAVNNLCFAVSLTGATTITSPGYYCLDNDVSGAFTIEANDVVLDLNNHTVSTGGILVLTGTNRTIKNGRLNSSNAGIVLTSNTASIIENISITNPSTTAITFANPHYDNKVRNVVIENGTIGLSSVDDTNLSIQDLTIQGMSSVGMTFTSSTNLNLHNVSIVNTIQDGIDFNNLNYSTISDVTIYNARSSGINALGLTNGCIFQNIAVDIQAVYLNNGYNFANAQACLMRNCSFTGIGTTTVARERRAISLVSGFANTFDQCTVKNIVGHNAGADQTYGIKLDASAQDNVVSNCVVQTLVGNNGTGIDSTGDGNSFFNCIVQDVSVNNGNCSGLGFDGDSCLIFDCIAENISGGSAEGQRGNGFRFEGGQNSCFDCIASNITAASDIAFGFSFKEDENFAKGCFARNVTDTGFVNDETADGLVYQCLARGCGSGYRNPGSDFNFYIESIAILNTNGFNLANPLPIPLGVAYCYAAKNSSGMPAAVPNRQTPGATPVVAGVNING